ncbi:Hypothetical protein D9617_3g018920 [Elsinoe fawcettii]|nr:Hypothetical protein D9617_3g018920 [Elsinoe fawcettii]
MWSGRNEQEKTLEEQQDRRPSIFRHPFRWIQWQPYPVSPKSNGQGDLEWAKRDNNFKPSVDSETEENKRIDSGPGGDELQAEKSVSREGSEPTIESASLPDAERLLSTPDNQALRADPISPDNYDVDNAALICGTQRLVDETTESSAAKSQHLNRSSSRSARTRGRPNATECSPHASPYCADNDLYNIGPRITSVATSDSFESEANAGSTAATARPASARESGGRLHESRITSVATCPPDRPHTPPRALSGKKSSLRSPATPHRNMRVCIPEEGKHKIIEVSRERTHYGVIRHETREEFERMISVIMQATEEEAADIRKAFTRTIGARELNRLYGLPSEDDLSPEKQAGLMQFDSQQKNIGPVSLTKAARLRFARQAETLADEVPQDSKHFMRTLAKGMDRGTARSLIEAEQSKKRQEALASELQGAEIMRNNHFARVPRSIRSRSLSHEPREAVDGGALRRVRSHEDMGPVPEDLHNLPVHDGRPAADPPLRPLTPRTTPAQPPDSIEFAETTEVEVPKDKMEKSPASPRTASPSRPRGPGADATRKIAAPAGKPVSRKRDGLAEREMNVPSSGCQSGGWSVEHVEDVSQQDENTPSKVKITSKTSESPTVETSQATATVERFSSLAPSTPIGSIDGAQEEPPQTQSRRSLVERLRALQSSTPPGPQKISRRKWQEVFTSNRSAQQSPEVQTASSAVSVEQESEATPKRSNRGGSQRISSPSSTPSQDQWESASSSEQLKQARLELQVKTELLRHHGIVDPFTLARTRTCSSLTNPNHTATLPLVPRVHSWLDTLINEPSDPHTTPASPPSSTRNEEDNNALSSSTSTPRVSPTNPPTNRSGSEAMMAAPNGMQPGGGAPYPLGSAIMPSAGHHQDMAHVWGLVEQLSGVLHQNRKEWEDLQRDLGKVKVKDASKGEGDGEGDEGGEENGQSSEETVAELQTKLVEQEREIEALKAAYLDQGQLVTEYENGLQAMVKLLHQRSSEREAETNAIHAHYLNLLSASHNETVQAQLTHQAWQASLQRVSEGVRSAYRDKTEQALPYMKKIAGLKEENRLLRQKVGWDPPSDSEAEEEESPEEQKRGR